jgi:hypothetical protein
MLKTQLSYGLEVPLLGLYSRQIRTCVHTGAGTWTFIMAVFIKAPKWKQLKSPSTDERINKLILFSHKRE